MGFRNSLVTIVECPIILVSRGTDVMSVTVPLQGGQIQSLLTSIF
jgi:hypothetical protein